MSASTRLPTTPSPSPAAPPAYDRAAHRARIASVVSSLRRVTPRVPFWRLAAHRLPTLWTLYRGLLRSAPSEIVRPASALCSPSRVCGGSRVGPGR